MTTNGVQFTSCSDIPFDKTRDLTTHKEQSLRIWKRLVNGHRAIFTVILFKTHRYLICWDISLNDNPWYDILYTYTFVYSFCYIEGSFSVDHTLSKTVEFRHKIFISGSSADHRQLCWMLILNFFLLLRIAPSSIEWDLFNDQAARYRNSNSMASH